MFGTLLTPHAMGTTEHREDRTTAGDVYLGTGECARLIRAVDWRRTQLGEMLTWPSQLKTLLGATLNSRQPMLLWWGSELVQFFNDAYLEVGGPQLTQSMGQRAADCWSEIWSEVAPQVDVVMAGRGATWQEDSLIPQRRNGSVQDLYWSYGFSPVVGDAGEVLGILVIANDTTERVVGARRRAALQALADALSHCRSEADVPNAAQAAVEPSSEIETLLFFQGLVTQSLRSWPSEPGQRDARFATAVREMLDTRLDILQTMHSGEPALIQVGAEGGRDGDRARANCFVVPILVDAETPADRVAVFALHPRRAFDLAHRRFLMEVTERVAQTSARLEAAASRALAMQDRDNQLLQAPIATAIVLGPDLVFGLANPLYCKVSGRDIQVGKRFEESFPELVGTPLPGLFKQSYRTGQPYVSPETMLMLDRNGSGELEECYFQYNLQPMRASNGEVYGLMIVAVDLTTWVLNQRRTNEEHQRRQAAVTERSERLEQLISDRTTELQSANALLKTTNHELALSRDAARSASRAKSAFVANMSHEIRTPLNGILGLTHLLARDPRDQQQADRLARIGRSGQHLLQIVNDVLDLSKIEAGKLELEEADFTLEALLASTLAMIEDRARSKGLQLSLQTDKLPPNSRGDPTRISQILLNLLSNAVKFTEAGTVELRCRVVANTGNEVTVRFEVQDTGTGIAAEHQAALFKAFEQGDNSTTRRYGGTGLGLSLTRELVHAMGGEVGVNSVLGAGSTFWATVRLQQASAAASGAAPSTIGSLRALLVDDDAPSCEQIATLLADMGIGAHVARSGSEALTDVEAEMTAGRPYDLMLIAQHMRGLDGGQTLVAIKEVMGNGMPPTILLGTGHESDLFDEAEDMAFNAALIKPATKTALRDCIAPLLRRRDVRGSSDETDLDAAENLLKSRHRGQRVLVAEDNPINQMVADELLSAAGLVVEIAADGRIALDLAVRRSYDLILMDVQMPNMDGLAATRQLRAHGRDSLPIIAMTANAFVEDRAACLDAGMTDHIAKPIQPAALYSVLLRWLPMPDPALP